MTRKFPLEKSDIHYDPSSEEVSMKREKFDAFVKYVQGLQEKLETVEDAGDVATYRARKAEKTSDVLQALTEDVLEGTAAVRQWLESPNHTIRELSARTGISYATCHRIVNERLGTPNVGIGHLNKMVSAVLGDQGTSVPRAELHPRYKRVLLGLGEGLAEDNLVSSLQTKGTEVATVHAGLEVARKVAELHPDLVMLDVSMPNLMKNHLEVLRKFAEDAKGTIILTGESIETTSALFESLFRNKSSAEQVTVEAVGG